MRAAGFPLMTSLLLVLAACVDAGATEKSEPATSAPAPPATVDAQTGGMEGSVTDDSLNPIPGAGVAILGQNLTTETDATGRFSFSHVAPGKAQVVVGKIGYTQVGRAVEVQAGEIVQLDFVLEVLAIKEPYYRTLTQAGFIGCSVDVRQSSSNGSLFTFAACGLIYYAGAPTVDRFRVDWDLGVTDNTTGLWAESTWRSTQAAGNGLFVWWVTYKNDALNSLLQVRGKDPLRGPIDGKAFLKVRGGGNTPTGAVCSNACHLTTFHYTWANTFNNQYPIEAGVTIQQRIDDYVTIFFDGDLPEVFTALPK